jgi:hypothetical protein
MDKTNIDDDIVSRLTISTGHSPSECWGCGEFGCTNSVGAYVPCYCEGKCDCDNECSCDCHEWYVIVNDAKAEIERLRAEVARLGSFLHPIGMVINAKEGKNFDAEKIAELIAKAVRGE